MKKFLLILAISTLSICMSTAIALAGGGNQWKNFHGTYEMSASGSCIHSQNGYDSTSGWFIPLPGIVYAGTTVSNGTWVFKKNGQGTYSYTMYATVTPPIEQPPNQEPPCTIPGGIRIFSSLHEENGNDVNEYTFTYDITNFGDITIHTAEGDTLEGSISIDKKAITLFDVLREKPPEVIAPCPWWKIICTATRTLIKVHD